MGADDAAEVAATVELVGDGDHVDGAATGVHVPGDLVQRGVRAAEEVFRVEATDDVVPAGVLADERAEHCAFGVEVDERGVRHRVPFPVRIAVA